MKTVKDDIFELIIQFAGLESELHVCKTVTDNLNKYVKTLEQQSYENEQYSSRESLEIPDSINNNDMECFELIFKI